MSSQSIPKLLKLKDYIFPAASTCMPFEAACFPYAQHFVTTSVPTATTMRTADDLEQAVTEISDEMNEPLETDCAE